MATFTGPRYFPEFEWSTSLVYNAFRCYEYIFGRKFGIRAEATSSWGNGETYYAFHTTEAALVHLEYWIRGLVPRTIPVRVCIPILWTPQGMPVFASPYLFAIAFDATSQGNNGSATSLTISHTCTGSNRILFTAVGQGISSADQVTGVTYNSISETRVTTQTNSSTTNDERGYLYCLPAPSTGTNNVVISWNTTEDCRGNNSSYSGSANSQPEVSGGFQTAAVTSSTFALTTLTNNAWMVSMIFTYNGTTISAGTGTTKRSTTGLTYEVIGDSGGPITPAASYSMGWTFGSSSSITVQAGFAPFSAALANSSFLAFM